MAQFNLCDILQMKLCCRHSARNSFQEFGRTREGWRDQNRKLPISIGDRREDVGGRKRKNYNLEFILSFSFFLCKEIPKICMHIQCSHLITRFCWSVLVGLKLIEQLLQAVCDSCCGYSPHTSAGNAALPDMWPQQREWGTVCLHIMFADE